jgi:hypothetical protein
MGELSVGIHGGDKDTNVLVTDRGELVVAPLSFSTPYYVSVATLNTAFEVVPASARQCFVITGLLLASDKNFGSATVAETLTIYEANAADLDTNLKTIVKVDLLKNDRLVATGLNLLVGQARSLIAIGTDDAVDVTIAGYYVNG